MQATEARNHPWMVSVDLRHAMNMRAFLQSVTSGRRVRDPVLAPSEVWSAVPSGPLLRWGVAPTRTPRPLGPDPGLHTCRGGRRHPGGRQESMVSRVCTPPPIHGTALRGVLAASVPPGIHSLNSQALARGIGSNPTRPCSGRRWFSSVTAVFTRDAAAWLGSQDVQGSSRRRGVVTHAQRS